jgi:5-formyltetrahydrofolate cyclo-ligase
MSNESQAALHKSRIRREAIRRRKELDASTRDEASTVIAHKLTSRGFFRRARTIGCYLSIDAEVDTTEIILRALAMKKRIFAPVIEKSLRMCFKEVSANCDVLPNRFGIMEPSSGARMSAHKLDIVVTPCVAFDAMGNRVGMGGGYFDRTFSFQQNRQSYFRPKLIGVAFDCQKVEKITANPWDIRVFCTVTEID